MKTRDSMVLVAAFAAVLAGSMGPASAQTLDHLKCEKVKDPLRLKGPKPSWLDLTGVDGSTEQCRIVGAFRLACTPVHKEVTASIQRKLDGGFEDFVPAPSDGRPEGDKLCYKIRCTDPGPPDRDVTDQFGSRTVEKLKPFLLCGPIECDGAAYCEGRCTDTQSDPDNCGGCGNTCADGMSCNAGVCECPVGQTDCGGACVDTLFDADHCGACGNSCGFCFENSLRACDDGACGCECSDGFGNCSLGNGCETNLQTDSAHCGFCGNACADGESCSAGICECPADRAVCGGTCVDTQIARNHCGSCGNACADGASCNAGACECPDGQTSCDGTCVDTETDVAHCGSCGNACADGAFCGSGVCILHP